jgi:hypothetical protein
MDVGEKSVADRRQRRISPERLLEQAGRGTLVVARRTLAAHVEHIVAKLSAPMRTHAAVRGDRPGLYVPPRVEGGRPP